MTWEEVEELANTDALPREGTNPFEKRPSTPLISKRGANPFAAAPVAAPPTQSTPPSTAPPPAPVAAPQDNNAPSTTKRVIACIIDFVGLQALTTVFLSWEVNSLASGSFLKWMGLGSLPLYFVLMFGYAVATEVLWGGSIGKQIMGLAVVDAHTSQRLTWTQALRRNLWRFTKILPLVGWIITPTIGCVLIAQISNSPDRRGSHDRAANARVVSKFAHLN
ncbi:RDD family protein [Corynebacterium hindlerae]|uniref:RDD family protein n=1 Tax=Corynebacterium hindlerae TaxID=699041 RepID=UPI0031B68F7D